MSASCSTAALFATHNDWKREFITAVLSLFGGAMLGLAGEALATALMIGSYLLTGSAFIAFSLYWLTFAVSLVTAFYAGSAFGRYVLDRHIDRDWAKLKNKASSLFGSSRKVTEQVIHKARYTVRPAKGEA